MAARRLGPRWGDQISQVMANGTTSLMGLWTQMRDHLEWMRQHNRTAAQPVGFYGIDLPGSMVSLLPGLDAVTSYLAQADPGFQADPGLRETASAWAAASAFPAPAAISAYGQLTTGTRDALTAGLAGLSARMTARRLLAAHNGHVQRWPATLPGLPPSTTMGMRLADRLGQDYVVIGTTSGTGQTLNTGPDFYSGRLFTALEEAPQPGSLDALMADSHAGPFATRLCGLPRRRRRRSMSLTGARPWWPGRASAWPSGRRRPQRRTSGGVRRPGRKAPARGAATRRSAGPGRRSCPRIP